MQPIQKVTLKQLCNGKYASILCYPKYSVSEATKRIKQLKQLGVKALVFIGEKKAFNLSVLGKGYVGIVVAAQTETGLAALKIRRVDADRKEMEHEAEMLAEANRLGIGPRLIDRRKDFLLMEFLRGALLPQWVKSIEGKGARNRIRNVLRDILEQCFQLDQAGLDHGELSRAPKHIIVDAHDKPHIIDFETASRMRRKANVTSVCQYLFMKSQLSMIVRHRVSEINPEALVAALRAYKQQPTTQSFEKILKTCMLTQ